MPSLRVTSLNAQYIDHGIMCPTIAPRTVERMSVKVSARLTSNPAHNKGIVISLGSSWVLISMNAGSIIVHVMSNAAERARRTLKPQAMYPHVIAVNSSTAVPYSEIDALHREQRPANNT